MKNMLLVVIGCGVLLGACVNTTNSTTAGEAEQTPILAVEEKRGDTTKSGMLLKKGDTYFIQSPAGEMDEVESYAVELSDFVGKQVTVTGQYSGDTLFVGKIE